MIQRALDSFTKANFAPHNLWPLRRHRSPQSQESNTFALNLGYNFNTSYKLVSHYTNNAKNPEISNRNDVGEASWRGMIMCLT